MKTLGMLMLTTTLLFGQAPDRLAVLSINNTTGSERSFVEGMPDIIITELLRHTNQELVERGQVEAAIKELQLDIAGLTEEGSRKLGQWVGAERILLGTLTRLGNTYRLDLRIIQVQSGRILSAAEASAPLEHLNRLVPQAVSSLLAPERSQNPRAALAPPAITPAKTPPPSPAQTPVIVRPPQPNISETPGSVHIRYRTLLGLFTEKPVPLQKVKVFINEREVGTSALIDTVNKDFDLYVGQLPAGSHLVRLEHWVAGRDGKLRRLLEHQPETALVSVYPGGVRTVEYRMVVSSVRTNFNIPVVR